MKPIFRINNKYLEKSAIDFQNAPVQWLYKEVRYVKRVKRCQNCYSEKKKLIKIAIFVPLSYHSLSEGEIYVGFPKFSKFSFFGTVKGYKYLS